jgi:hypothetical protein
MGIFEANETDQSIPAQCTVHVCLSEGNAAISRHLSRRSLSAVAVQESLKPGMWVHEAETSRLGSKLSWSMQHRLDIAYDDYCTRRVGRSRVTTGTVACCHVRL